MGDVREVSNTVRGGSQSGGNVLQGGDTGGNPLWILYLVTFIVDGEDHGGDTHEVSEANHGGWAWRKSYGTWVTFRVEVLREAAVIKLEMTYIESLQGTLAQWVVLRPIFEVYTRDKGYEGGGRRRDT